MVTATSFLDQGQVAELEQAIARVEKQTSAEIVCAVATESGRYDRAEAIFGILFAVLTLLVVNLVVISRGNGPDRWTEFEGVEFTWQMVSLLAGFFVGNIIASFWHPVRRLLTGSAEKEQEVARSAAFVFAQQRIASTRAEGGLLIYLSLYERRAVVLADDGVMEATGQEFIDQLRDQAVAGLRSRTVAGGMVEVVEAAGVVLSEKMPQAAATGPTRPSSESTTKAATEPVSSEKMAEDTVAEAYGPDENELSNRVILIHPRP